MKLKKTCLNFYLEFFEQNIGRHVGVALGVVKRRHILLFCRVAFDSYMFRTLSRCLSPIFLRKNMNFQRAILPNITFAPGSHSRAYSTPSPPEPSHNDQPSQQRGDPFWGVIREYMVKPYEREIDAEALWRRKSLNVQASLEEYPPANPYTGLQQLLVHVWRLY